MSGSEKELPCRVQCTGTSVQWCLTKVDPMFNTQIIWRLCVGDEEWTMEGNGSPNLDSVSITSNNSLLIHRVTVFGYHNVLATCSIFDDSNMTLCNSTAIKIQVIGT